MPSPKKTKGEITKDKIIDATLELIAESGLHNVSARNIGTKAGVRHSLTTYYFGSVENLICQSFDRFALLELSTFSDLLIRVERLFELDHQPQVLIQAIARELVTFILSDSNPVRRKQVAIENQFIFSLNTCPELDDRLHRYNENIMSAVRGIMERCGSQELEADSYSLVSIFRYYELASAKGGHLSPSPDVLERVLQKLIQGIYQPQI